MSKHQLKFQVSGEVVFCSKKPKHRCIIKPSDGKLCIVDFLEPLQVKRGQTITVSGDYKTEGWESVVIADATLI